jgi:hypothetical protein
MLSGLDGGTVSAILIGFATLLTYLAGQVSTKARDQRRQIKTLRRRDIAWARWSHRVQVWAAERGYEGLPEQGKDLRNDDEDEEA